MSGWAEPLLFVALLSAFIWIAPALPLALAVACILGLAAIPIASNILHHDAPARLGFRLDNLTAAARHVAPVTALGALAIVAAGRLSGAAPRADIALAALGYPLWGLAQQYALQGFVHRRIAERWGENRTAAALSAGLFALVHLPNPVLVAGTAVAGYGWCRAHQRAPNLVVLALSHALLAALLLAALPLAWHHDLRIGPTYWTFPR
ncbi:MAG TPA: CPBP family glutamic-type intramembrane protease [Candidatus Eisenbacteria bacterium]|nr:CPBP family glutamic-type intramembrane protease [Candidatus Eisenbacteria bacterium]